MFIEATPILGVMFGINWLDWGEEVAQELGWRYEIQIALGIVIVQIKR